jgi:DNA-binding GntR family transcriptional regulator
MSPEASPPALETTSVEEAVYEVLRDEILDLHLAPGDRLRLRDLAARYGASPTPVRQALRRLESEGLVESSPRRGSQVAPLSIEELEEIQAIRLGVESVLARFGAPLCTPDVVAEMETAREHMERMYLEGDLRGYIRSFWQFRNPCYQQADRPRLLALADRQRTRIERYIALLRADISTFAGLRHYQDNFLDACRARDAVLAENVTRDGIWAVETGVAYMVESRAKELGGGE